MPDRASPAVMAALKEALEAQLAANDPPETRLTLARLLSEGISEDEAWRWLSAAMLQEMTLVMRYNRPFDREGYITALNHLPELRDR
jgi:hypothetical protein